MALSDKNIVITPNKGQSSDPKVVFSGADASTGPQNITLQVYPTNNGTLSFEGSSGQLLSVTNNLSGSIFYVNDISGIPSIEVLDTGLIKLAQYGGNVLIGTGTDSGVRLRVAGSGHITQLGVGSSNNNSFDFYNNGTSYFNGSVTIDDNLSISSGFTVDAPSFRDRDNTSYYVDPADSGTAGNFNGTVNAVVFNTTSDLRLKENLEQITDASEKVMQLRGMTYNFKNDEKKTRHAGVVAQDVLKVLPEAVTGSEQDQYRVSYGDLVGLLVEAVKELKMEIKQQQLEIAELRKGNTHGTVG